MTDPLARRLRASVLGAAVAAVALGAALPLHADPAEAVPTPEEALDPAQIAAMIAARAGGSSDAGSIDDLPDMDKIVDGLAKADNDEGALFEVYYADDAGAKDPSEIYGVIPPSLVGDDLLLATSVNSGPQAGYQWSDYLVRFERRGNNLALMVPDLSNRGEGPVKESVERTYTPTILTVLPIKAKGPGGSLVVDLSPLTLGRSIPVPGLRGAADPTLSRHPKVKVFPENVLIAAELVTGGRGSPASTSGMSYSFRRLPDRSVPMRGYQPRPSDERVGYFLTVSQDWGKPHDARETLDRYINRWEVEKLDSNLDMSPPKEPIVFYVEKTVPVQWRRYVQAGIDDWNQAFEKIGIVGAIQVRQQTDSEYADIDPEDARYNFIRWIVTGRAFAMGPSRVDPRTGQILDADIIFDDSMLRYFQQDLDLLGPKALAADLGPDTLAFWRDNPSFRPMNYTAAEVDDALAEVRSEQPAFTASGSNFAPHDDAASHLDAAERLATAAGEAGVVATPASKLSPLSGQCNHAVGARRQIAVAHLMHLAAAAAPTTQPSAESEMDEAAEAIEDAAEAMGEAVEEVVDAVEAQAAQVKKRDLPEEYLGRILQEVVAHEVGHTLGLRHNFKASSWLGLDEIKQRRGDPTQPTAASVMDYNPVLLFAGDDPAQAKTFITPVVGPYDEWAIEYGYSILPRRGWQAKLKQIADKAGRRELAYATDEDTMGLVSPDPLVNRYDMGDDPVAWAMSRVELADELMKGIEEWAVEPGESNDQLRRAFLNLFYEKVGGTYYVARQVGGQRFSRNRFADEVTTGDPAALTPLSAEEQRGAIHFLAGTVFADGFFDLDAELLNKIVPTREPSSTGWPTSRIDFAAHDAILSAQNRSLSALMSPTVMERLYDAQLKAVEGEKFTVAELLTGVKDAVWPDGITAEMKPDGIRRNLQTQHLGYLIAIAESEPGRRVNSDVHNLVRYQLRQMSQAMGEALKAGDLDMEIAAHLTESKSRIDRVLEAPLVKVDGGSPQMLIIMGQDGR